MLGFTGTRAPIVSPCCLGILRQKNAHRTTRWVFDLGLGLGGSSASAMMVVLRKGGTRMDDPVRVLLPCPQPQTDRDVLLNFLIKLYCGSLCSLLVAVVLGAPY